MMNIEDKLLKEYKEYMQQKSTFAKILKVIPSTPRNFTVFPTIIFSERSNADYLQAKSLNNMEYADILLYQVDIYSKDIILDKKKYPAREVIKELRILTADFFRQAGFIRNSDMPNNVLNNEIQRRTMTFEANLMSWNQIIE